MREQHTIEKQRDMIVARIYAWFGVDDELPDQAPASSELRGDSYGAVATHLAHLREADSILARMPLHRIGKLRLSICSCIAAAVIVFIVALLSGTGAVNAVQMSIGLTVFLSPLYIMLSCHAFSRREYLVLYRLACTHDPRAIVPVVDCMAKYYRSNNSTAAFVFNALGNALVHVLERLDARTADFLPDPQRDVLRTMLSGYPRGGWENTEVVDDAVVVGTMRALVAVRDTKALPGIHHVMVTTQNTELKSLARRSLATLDRRYTSRSLLRPSANPHPDAELVRPASGHNYSTSELLRGDSSTQNSQGLK